MKVLFKILFTIWLFAMLLNSLVANASDFNGRWQGELRINDAMSVELVFNVVRNGDSYTATMDVPAQQQFNLPFDTVKVEKHAIELALSAAGIAYTGKLTGDVINGTYAQSGAEFTLDMRRVTDVAIKQPKKTKPRPQEPSSAVDYVIEEVTFSNPEGGHKLAGTLTIPKQKVSHTAVLLSGSGPSNRDSFAFGHKVFLVLSDLLTKQGIAVLRFDDRGVGKSEGDHKSATSIDFASDAQAAIAFVRQHKTLAQSKVGFIGHSEGGLIATIAAASHAPIDFMVSLAGPGTSGEQILIDQSREIHRLMGASEAVLKESDKAQRQILRAIVQDKSREELKQLMATAGMNDQQIGQQLAQIDTPWFRTFVKTDPAKYLPKINVPVLALNGGKDVQVLAEPNISGFKHHVKSNLLMAKIYDNLNHLFQPASTGLPNEYAEIDITFSPQVAKDIAQWVITQ
ncbi:alpha/beta hydrolase family protein [Thalassotalea fusca]